MKLNENQIESLKREQQLRLERIVKGLDTEGYWWITGAILGWGWGSCDEEYVTKVIKEFEEKTKQ